MEKGLEKKVSLVGIAGMIIGIHLLLAASIFNTASRTNAYNSNAQMEYGSYNSALAHAGTATIVGSASMIMARYRLRQEVRVNT